MPGYVDVDAGASWRFSRHLELRGAARNLLNKAYYSSPDRRWVYAAGRSVSLTIVTGF
jgi:outer membrane receptor protein involved in Fe transport